MADDLSAIYASLGLGNPTATANDLSSFQNNVLSTDPWNIAAKSLGSFQPNMQTWSPTTQIATSFGKNFLAGIMGQYARNDAAEQLNKVVQVMPQLRTDALGVATPEGVDESAFSTLRSGQVLKNLEAQAQAAQSENELRNAIKKAGLIKEAEILGENKAYGLVAPGAKNPNSPGYKVDQDLFKIEQSYTDKLLTGVEPQRVMGMNRAATNILEAIKKDNPLAASTAIFEYAKLQDPTGTVREADEMRVSDPGGPLGQLAQLHNQITGEGKLTPEAKKAMRELVPILQDSTFSQYNQMRDSYLDAAKGYGADPSRIKYLKPTDLSSYLEDQTLKVDPTIPPGMKLQRNSKGETRLVPQ